MSDTAPEAVDLTKESDATRSLYGMDDEDTKAFGTNCLLARRLVERGVRFIELYCGSGSGWDAHENVERLLCAVRHCHIVTRSDHAARDADMPRDGLAQSRVTGGMAV